IAALSQPEAAASLAERRWLADTLGTELDAAEAKFVDGCRRELAEKLAGVQRATKVLTSAAVALPPLEPLAIPPDAKPRAAAQAVIDAARRMSLLSRTARASLADLQHRATKARDEIAHLRPDELAPGDRQTKERLTKALNAVLTLEGLPVW